MRGLALAVLAAIALAPVLTGSAAAARSYGTAEDFAYDIAPDVPPHEIAVIKTGLMFAESYLEEQLGGGLPAPYRKQITVKIVATGRGNEEYGGGNGVATAFSGGKPRPFFDVANVQWNQNSAGRGWTTQADSMKTVAHEYGHVWQGYFGALSDRRQPMPNWVNEGMAELIGYLVMIDAGQMQMPDIRRFVMNGAMQGEMSVPLDRVGVWPGHVGFIALDWLLEDAPNGLAALRIVCAQTGKTGDFAPAFRQAFGLELADFYRQFEDWRKVAIANPDGALENRPALVR